MNSTILIFILAAIGIGETVYLIRKRIAAQAPVCPIGGDCMNVLMSKYNNFLGIPNDIIGLLFYAVVLAITSFLIIGIGPVFGFSLGLLNLGLKILVGAGSLASLYLTFLQWKIIKSWCFWCLMSAFTIWLMGIMLLLNNLA